MKKSFRGLLLCSIWLLCAFLLSLSSAEGVFEVVSPGDISGYQSNPLNVTAPEEGALCIEIRDENTLYRRIEKNVPSGKSQVLWDGLGWNEERMAHKQYTLEAVLTGASGKEYHAGTAITVVPAQQAVLFALPSDPDVYLADPSDWFLEFKILYTDQLVAEFFLDSSGEMVLRASRQAKGARVNRVSFSALTGKHTLKPGTYRVRVFGQRHPSYAAEFMLNLHDGSRPVLPLLVTGSIMPSADASDQEIWASMMEPATVVDINNTAHQKVYEDRDVGSRVLGTLHGQSQSLSVLAIEEDWVRISAWNHEKGAPMEGWVPKKVLKVVRPQTEYGILVNKKDQTLTLYQRGEKIDTLLVSTGRMERNELYQETAAGSFLTDEHMSDYSTNGLKYDFVIRYDGGNLLHQIPYAWDESGKKDLIPGEIVLGTKASHACIRIQETPSDQGINAYWFWTHIPYHTRVIVLDDPEEREKLETLVTGRTPDLMDGLNASWQVEPEDTGDSVLITFGGDVVLGARESYYGLEDSLPAFLEAKGSDWFFSGLSPLFLNDDLSVVNLECVLKDDAQDEDLTKSWRFRGLTDYARILPACGIDLVNLANNHTIDYGASGYESTLRALEGLIPFCGNGTNTILSIRGHLFGFGGCRETNYKLSPDIIQKDILELREKGAEFVIYQCHWGTEYEENHNVLQEAMARACFRAGADLVIGHHPHVVQGIDYIGDMPVVYSLGNLMFGGTIRLKTYDAILVQARFYPGRDNHRVSLRLIPVTTSSSAAQKINDYRPVQVFRDDALRILKKVQKDTPVLLTEYALLDY